MNGSKSGISTGSASFIFLMMLILSTILSMTSAGDPLPPAVTPPGDLTARSGRDRIHLEWTEPEIGYIITTGFAVYRSVDDLDFTILVRLSREIFEFQDEEIAIGITYQYFITTMSDQGESDASKIVESIADDQPPRIEINDPAPDEVIGIDEVSVSFNIDERHSGIRETVYTIDDGPEHNIDNTVSFTIEHLSDGPHEIVMVSTDNAGNEASLSRTFTIDTEAPSLLILSPAQDDVLAGSDVTVELSASDDVTSVVNVLISVDGGKEIEISPDEDYRIGHLVSGIHEIILMARDEAGNTGSDAVNFVTDNDLPSVRITNPPNNTVTANSDVTMEWVGNDPTTDHHYQVSVNGETWLDVGNADSYTIKGLEEGKSSITVRIIDSVLNTHQDTIEMIVDRTGPVFDTGSLEQPVISTGGRIDIEWIVSDSYSHVTRMEYLINGDGPFSLSDFRGITLKDLENGDHTLQVNAYDLTGNRGEILFDLEVDTIIPTIIDQDPEGTISRIPSNIAITFSEEMDPSTMKITSVHPDARISGYGNHFSIDTGVQMDFGETYEFHVTGKDLNGIGMDGTVIRFEISDISVIEGRVVDKDGRAINGATVTLSTGKVATSGSDGKFRVEERMGNITVYVTKDGYERAEMTIRSRPDRENWAGTFKLEEDGLDVGSRIGNFLSSPINILLLGILMCILVIASTLFWRYLDRERYDDIDVEWDEGA